jgi:hypothetical protein
MGRQADMTKLIVAFHKFAKAPKNDIKEEFWNGLAIENRRYFCLQKLFVSDVIFRMTKILLRETLLRFALLYGAECWIMSRTGDKMVDECES